MMRRLCALIGAGQDAPTRPVPGDANEALGAVLVRIARADDHYSSVEIDKIEAVLSASLGLTSEEARSLRLRCEAIEANAADNHRFVRQIKANVPLDERGAIVEMMWEIVLADAKRSPDEEMIMRLLGPMLGISDQESAQLRQKVAKRLG